MDLLLSVFTLKRYALRITRYALRKPVLHQDSLQCTLSLATGIC